MRRVLRWPLPWVTPAPLGPRLTGRTKNWEKLSRMVLLFCIAVGSLLNSAAGDSPPLRASYNWVYSNPRWVPGGGDGMPFPLDYTHMGMLAVLPSGQLAAAFQGSQLFWEGSSLQGLYLSLSSQQNSDSWTVPNLITKPVGNTPYWAPVLYVEDQKTYLLYAHSRKPCWSQSAAGVHWACGGDIMMMSSDDSGNTWSDPQMVYPYEADGGIGKMVANQLVLGRSGEWILPFWREMGGQNCSQNHGEHGKAGVLISYDKGQTWDVKEVPLSEGSPPTWLIEAAIAPYGDIHAKRRGYLQVFRTSLGSIYSATSKDGHNWTPAKPSTLPNPNSKVDIIGLPDGSILIAYNNNDTARTPLTIARSFDGGLSWRNVIVVENDPIGSFAYPTLLYETSTDAVKVIYTVNYPNTTTTGPNIHGWNVYGIRLATIDNFSQGSLQGSDQ